MSARTDPEDYYDRDLHELHRWEREMAATVTTEHFGNLVVGNSYSAFDLAEINPGTFSPHRGHAGDLTFDGVTSGTLEFRCGCGDLVAIRDTIIPRKPWER